MRRARGTGTIEKRIMASGAIKYFARCPNASRTPLGLYDSWQSASDALDVYREDNAAGLLVDAKKLGDYGASIIDRRELDGYRSTRGERSIWRCHVESWGCADWSIAHVKRTHVLEWIRALRGKGVEGQTLTNAVNLLRAVFRAAVEDDELIDENPVPERVRKKGKTRVTSTHLTMAELGAVVWGCIDAEDIEAAMLIAFAATTGMRSGELRSLRPEDVRLTGERPCAIVRYGAPGKPTKNGKIRRVPLFGVALEVARAWDRWWVPRDAKRYQIVEREAFFATATGRPRPPWQILDSSGERWTEAISRAGITRRVRWHDLRHTCATLLLSGALTGEAWSIEAVREMLGHSSTMVTERYAHVTGALAERAARGQANDKPTATEEIMIDLVSAPPRRIERPANGLGNDLKTARARALAGASWLDSVEPLALRRGVELAIAVLVRADEKGDVPRAIVEAACETLDAWEAERATMAVSS